MTYKIIQKYLLYLIYFFSLILLVSMIFFLCELLNYTLIASLILFFYVYYKINNIQETTLCLIVKENKVLMMLRNKKKNDVHINKYNGLGGKLEKGESKKEGVLREVFEEAGVKLTDYNYVGTVVFKNFGYKLGKEIMYCFVGFDYQNEVGYCNEGTLEWIDKERILELPLWEGDQYFIMNIIENKSFKAFLHYKEDKVVNYRIKIKEK